MEDLARDACGVQVPRSGLLVGQGGHVAPWAGRDVGWVVCFFACRSIGAGWFSPAEGGAGGLWEVDRGAGACTNARLCPDTTAAEDRGCSGRLQHEPTALLNPTTYTKPDKG
ncbi:hypothetical protein BRADI_1g04145v3 [Brachypodium distachyon]|uniref:Uncharacterized protein n=1 Tax=Brachypodium distachyon TaxID=15368 RepID=A0A2K2DI03_BRADI|nr:hypothetical protein BRADI_1g04145v3 [Brachypodium distachyon]